MDIFCPSLEYSALIYHNTGLTSITNNWIAFDLWGTNSNRDALGALVTLYAGDMKLVRYNRAARSWKIQDNTYIHFGIAQETTVDSVVIRWPLGNTQVITNPAINTYHKVEESGSAVDNSQTTDGLPTSFALQQNYPNPFNPTTRIDYSIPVSGQVNLTVFDINGRQVYHLLMAIKQQELFPHCGTVVIEMGTLFQAVFMFTVLLPIILLNHERCCL